MQKRDNAKKVPWKLFIYGVKGVGKTRYAGQCPKVGFIDIEKGSSQYGFNAYVDFHTAKEVDNAVNLFANDSKVDTIAIDSVDWLEKIYIAEILKESSSTSLSKAMGGYGAGYETLLTRWITFKRLLEKTKKNIILIGHAGKPVEFNDPTAETAYHTFSLKLTETKNVSVGDFLSEWVDDLFFINFKTFSKGEGKGTRGTMAEHATVFTKKSAGYDAKTRSVLPKEMPLDWNFYQAAKIFKAKPINYEEECDTILIKKNDPDLSKRVANAIIKAEGNKAQLEKIWRHLKNG